MLTPDEVRWLRREMRGEVCACCGAGRPWSINADVCDSCEAKLIATLMEQRVERGHARCLANLEKIAGVI